MRQNQRGNVQKSRNDYGSRSKVGRNYVNSRHNYHRGTENNVPVNLDGVEVKNETKSWQSEVSESVIQHFLGQLVEIETDKKSRIIGVLVAISPKGEVGMKSCVEFPHVNNPQAIVKKKQLMTGSLSTIRSITLFKPQITFISKDFVTDKEIANVKPKPISICNEDNLIPFNDFDDVVVEENLIALGCKNQNDCLFEPKEMFKINQSKFGVTSTFCEDMRDYNSVVLDVNQPDFKEKKKYADKIAAEIEKSKGTGNYDDDEGGEEEDDGKNYETEELRYSAVQVKGSMVVAKGEKKNNNEIVKEKQVTSASDSVKDTLVQASTNLPAAVPVSTYSVTAPWNLNASEFVPKSSQQASNNVDEHANGEDHREFIPPPPATFGDSDDVNKLNSIPPPTAFGLPSTNPFFGYGLLRPPFPPYTQPMPGLAMPQPVVNDNNSQFEQGSHKSFIPTNINPMPSVYPSFSPFNPTGAPGGFATAQNRGVNLPPMGPPASNIHHPIDPLQFMYHQWILSTALQNSQASTANHHPHPHHHHAGMDLSNGFYPPYPYILPSPMNGLVAPPTMQAPGPMYNYIHPPNMLPFNMAHFHHPNINNVPAEISVNNSTAPVVESSSSSSADGNGSVAVNTNTTTTIGTPASTTTTTTTKPVLEN